ncbi:MAG: radical SAM family heme chaperone HemW, partial [Sulfurimonas sp.]|nr:radical SAM family heme chaperone HemW [Sulfurimonas sp.]
MLLYIHIPFCDSKCSYCAFNSYVDKFHLKEIYMEALCTQLQFEIKRFSVTPKSIESLFIGGGTPSTVSPKLYEKLFSMLDPYLAKNIEITSEANPNSATLEWLEGMFALGVNRISFGVQSFNKEKLRILNRAHNASQAEEAILNAQKVGYKNISLDLIYATLGDTKELLENDLLRAFSLPINHLSAYALTIEEGTPFESKPHMSKERLSLTSWLFKKIKKFG